MKYNFNIYHKLFIRFFLIVGVVSGFAFLIVKGFNFTAAIVAVLGLILFFDTYQFIKNAFLLFDKTILSILYNDFSADFSNLKKNKNYENLYKLYQQLKSKKHDQELKDWIYATIVNSMESGILILRKEKNEWLVFMMNDYFSSKFEMPKVTKWQYLKNKMQSFTEIIERNEFQDLKLTLDIRINEEENQAFILQGNRSKVYENEYYIVLLESVQNVVEKKEKETWINLMRVISHELLNSLTPIRSLSQSLDYLMRQDNLNKSDLDEMQLITQTILNRTDHLQNFVENYRILSTLPLPRKKNIEISDLINNVLNLMSSVFETEKIKVTNEIESKYRIDIDAEQMEQVFINLFTNSVYALDGFEEKNIEIKSELRNKRILISITDNGKGIEEEIKDKIFLPFFTTRENGAGIGLTLSRNIVEAHGGYLFYNYTETQTRFVISLAV